MRIIFTIGGLNPEIGGPARSIPALCDALSRHGVEVEIVSLDYGKKFDEPVTPEAKSVRTTFVDCSSVFARRMQWTSRFRSMLRERCRASNVQIVHDTGVWLLTNHASATVSRQLHLPRLISPRGMLTSWALRYKGLKKKIAWTLYQRRDLLTADLLHATSQQEANDFRRAGFRGPIAVVPNGVDLPEFRPRQANGAPRTALCVARLHPIKGLMNLVEAWSEVRPSGWRMVIVGGDENGHAAELQAAVAERGLSSAFEFLGVVEGEAKWTQYRNADLFILPSHSENFGLAIAEALGSGLPVITTRGTPWRDIVEHRCGWWVEVGVESLAAALREGTQLSDEQRREMGCRGRALILHKYSWEKVAQEMKAVYGWILGTAPKPECVLA